MYAIIADGGRQYRLEEGQEVEVDYREASTGQEIEFGRVLAVSTEGPAVGPVDSRWRQGHGPGAGDRPGRQDLRAEVPAAQELPSPNRTPADVHPRAHQQDRHRLTPQRSGSTPARSVLHEARIPRADPPFQGGRRKCLATGRGLLGTTRLTSSSWPSVSRQLPRLSWPSCDAGPLGR